MYFTNIQSVEELRKNYHTLCLKMHPDKGGDHAAFVEMQNEYERIIDGAINNAFFDAAREGKRAPQWTTQAEKKIMAKIDQLMKVPGIVIEVCGSWLWVGGDTFPVHEQIKGMGFRFSRNKKRWYWSPYCSQGKRRARFRSMKQVREQYGSVEIESEAQTVMQLAAA